MKLVDVVAVITEAIAELNLPATVAGRIDARFIRRHNLLRGVYWLSRQPSIARTVSPIGTVRSMYEGLETEEQVIAQFRDSFPGADDQELQRRIIQPNRRHFDARGRLRDGWRRFEIQETMIDIFETYIHAVADELDAPLFWVDSWFYHVHAGGIHCGTNVLRVPGRGSALPRVWTVADVVYEETVEMEDEEIVVPAR